MYSFWGEVVVGFKEHVCIWGEDSSLKTRVVTHPVDSGSGWPQHILTTAANDHATPGPTEVVRYNKFKTKSF